MKSLLLVLCMMVLVVSPCFAQQQSVTPVAKKMAPQAVETKTVSGEVKSVTLADPLKETKSEIVIVDKSGTSPKEYTLLVKSITTIYDADWKAITLDKIKQGDNVKAVYLTTKEGVLEATSIKIGK